MNSEKLMRFAAVAAAALMSAVPLAAQKNNPQYHHYQLIDVGTFGGPASYYFGTTRSLNNQGSAAGSADTTTPDPFPSFCLGPNCLVTHAFQWKNGNLIDLGTLAPGWSSQIFWISGNGNIAGISENGEIDPLVGIPEIHAVLWQNGGITNLGTLQGGYESFGEAVNNRTQVVGVFLNTTPDSFSLFQYTTQTRAFLWRAGVMQDLGTLGGPDAVAYYLNESGQVAGYSYINSIPNSGRHPCGVNVPTVDPFLWQKGKGMTDLGTLGGTCGFPVALNDQGQVAGISFTAGDAMVHPFLWTTPGPIQDLGTLGGKNASPAWINDNGEVVGEADVPGSQAHDAFLWNNGVMTDLGTLPGDSCSSAFKINMLGQVVGDSASQALCGIAGERAFLWENGGPMVDLNTLIPPGSNLQLALADAINDAGEIVGIGLPSGCPPEYFNFCGHAYVLIPCDDAHGGIQGCDYSIVDTEAAVPKTTPAVRDKFSIMPLSLLRPINRRRIPGLASLRPNYW